MPRIIFVIDRELDEEIPILDESHTSEADITPFLELDKLEFEEDKKLVIKKKW